MGALISSRQFGRTIFHAQGGCRWRGRWPGSPQTPSQRSFVDVARWYEAADAGGDLYLQAVDPETGKVYGRVEPLFRVELFAKDLGAAGAAPDDDDACRNSNITGIADATRLL